MTEIFTNGRAIEIDALAREIKAGIVKTGGKMPENEDGILAALGAYDASAHVTDTMDDEQLSEFLDEFVTSWMEIPEEEEENASGLGTEVKA